MLPPGISFNAISPKALAASKQAKLPRSFWAWDEIVEMNKGGYWPYTPNTNLLYGLSRSAGDDRSAKGSTTSSRATSVSPKRAARAVRAWGLRDPVRGPGRVFSPVLTGVMMPEGIDADAVRKLIYERFDMSLGTGPRQDEGPHVPHRPPRRLQRPDADGDARRLRDGAASWRACRSREAACRQAMDYLASEAKAAALKAAA